MEISVKFSTKCICQNYFIFIFWQTVQKTSIFSSKSWIVLCFFCFFLMFWGLGDFRNCFFLPRSFLFIGSNPILSTKSIKQVEKIDKSWREAILRRTFFLLAPRGVLMVRRERSRRELSNAVFRSDLQTRKLSVVAKHYFFRISVPMFDIVFF